jgi:hypothetical protein
MAKRPMTTVTERGKKGRSRPRRRTSGAATTSAVCRIDLVLPLQGSVLNRKGGKVSVYEIRVKGHLDGRWAEWFDGLAIANLENGDAVLSGEIVDQSELHGVLNKVRDLGLPLLALRSAGPVGQDSVRTSTTR